MRKYVAIVLALFVCGPAFAEISDGVVRIGVLNDTTGVFQDTNGMGSVEAARMAADDFAGGGKNIKVEVVFADHQNKADVGSSVVRQWLDVQKVDAVVDVPNSAVGLAINSLLRGSKATFLASSTATSDLTGKACSPNTVQWVNDTWATANATAAAMMERGGDSWYFLTVNFALGQAIEEEATKYIAAHGGKVLGSNRHPLGTSDFSSFLLQAQSSKAKVVGLANSGADTINSIKQASEFGLRESGQSLVAFLIFIQDVHSIGLQTAQRLLLTESFYWDMNENTRAFAKRFADRPGMKGRVPSANQAGVYSATLAYLKAVAAADSDDAAKVVPLMKSGTKGDPLFGNLSIREDGRVIHDVYLFEVKAPQESRYAWDDYTLLATVPADRAFRPMQEGGCSLLR